ncbi:MAG: peptide-methionine (S)-S-oxide reductase [Pseudomonadota bacterium]
MERCRVSSVWVADTGLICAGFGGGCHWCTEAVFQSLRGVRTVEQGFIRSEPPHDTWSEAIIAHFEPALIGLDTLIAVHVRTHAATSNHTLRGKYRSAVYTFDDAQTENARTHLAQEAQNFEETLVTQALPFQSFKASDERFQNYYATRPDRPFCATYIDPKLAEIRLCFSDYAAT